MIAKFTCIDGKRDDLYAGLAPMMDHVESEEGTLLYQLLEDPNDANVAYITRWSDTDWRAQLNLLNLFDTVHYEAGSTRYAYPGTPLAAQLTLAASF